MLPITHSRRLPRVRYFYEFGVYSAILFVFLLAMDYAHSFLKSWRIQGLQ